MSQKQTKRAYYMWKAGRTFETVQAELGCSEDDLSELWENFNNGYKP